MAAVKRKTAQGVGFAKTMWEGPFAPEGEHALLIQNLRMVEGGVLENRPRWMQLIPGVWNQSGLLTPPPSAFADGNLLGMQFLALDGGERPEIIFLTKTGVFRYAPWNRATASVGSRGLEEQLEYRSSGTTTASVIPQASPQFPPTMEAVGNRLYFTFADGGPAWVWDGHRCRRFGYTQRPGAPEPVGPTRKSTTAIEANDGSFHVRGRIGTTEGDWADNSGNVVGGVDDGEWKYAVVYEGTDGAYSPMSPVGGSVTMRRATAMVAVPVELLRRKFWLRNIPTGPDGTVARILLRTWNLRRLPAGDVGQYRLLRRIGENISTDFIDNVPDAELGAVWDEREAIPAFTFARFFGGSMFMARTRGAPARVWWSEQALVGPIVESILQGHWRDVFPETGEITGLLATRHHSQADDAGSALLVFKARAVHYITGKYPEWSFGTLHLGSGSPGPKLAQNCPDGSVVWYGGNGTFWRLDPSGQVQDIGEGIRKTLKRVNSVAARFGESYLDERAGEAVFCLPVDDYDQPTMFFHWDYLRGGWRLSSQFKVQGGVLNIPGTDVVLLGGKYRSGNTTTFESSAYDQVFILHRGHPGEDHRAHAADAVYRTGWVPLAGEAHAFAHLDQLILTLEERGYGTLSTSCYIDFDADNINGGTESSVKTSHPENDLAYCAGSGTTVPSASQAVYGTSKWRAERVYTHLVEMAAGPDSCEVLMVEVRAQKPYAIYGVAATASFVASPGGRTPAS